MSAMRIEPAAGPNESGPPGHRRSGGPRLTWTSRSIPPREAATWGSRVIDNFRIIPIPFTGTVGYICMVLWFGRGGNPAGYLQAAISIAFAVALNVSFAGWLSPRQTGRGWLKWGWLPLSVIPVFWWVIYFVL